VRPGKELILSVSIALPDGLKLNLDAPTSYEVEPLESEGVIDRSALGTAQPAELTDDRFEVKLPLAKQAGSDRLKFSLVYYTCREGAEGVCKIQSTVWTIPLRLSPTAKADRIELSDSISAQ
jgi:hypothetical protein